jgi:Ni,Fe-hydrogenase I cytochrome b subunit
VDGGRDRLTGRLHLVVALLTVWLLATSPWIAMYRRLPAHPGWLDLAHVALGFVALACGVPYLYACVQGGRWRLYFPWLAGEGGAAGRDLLGLVKGRIPSAEGGGLFGLIEGLALLSLLATAATGAVWFMTQGTSEALAWREAHALAARALIAFVVAHVITVSLHLIELIRES